MDVTRLHVTFDVYSGRPNPTVTLSGADADALLARLAPGEPVGPDSPAEPQPRLGYRGLVFTRQGTRHPVLPETFRLVGGRLLGHGLRHWVADPSVEDLICSGQGLAGFVFTEPEALASLAGQVAAARASEWWRPPFPGLPEVTPCPNAPAPGFHRWNDALARMIECNQQTKTPTWCRECTNNCYNYATNIRSDTFGQPGYASGMPLLPPSITAATVLRYAFYDGLYYAPSAVATTCLPPGQTLVALVINPTPGSQDYHWYRRNSDGYWGHKAGTGPATDLDFSSNKITDPQTCDRGAYTVWAGYLVVVSGGVRVGGPDMPHHLEVPLPAGLGASPAR